MHVPKVVQQERQHHFHVEDTDTCPHGPNVSLSLSLLSLGGCRRTSPRSAHKVFLQGWGAKRRKNRKNLKPKEPALSRVGSILPKQIKTAACLSLGRSQRRVSFVWFWPVRCVFTWPGGVFFWSRSAGRANPRVADVRPWTPRVDTTPLSWVELNELSVP